MQVALTVASQIRKIFASEIGRKKNFAWGNPSAQHSKKPIQGLELPPWQSSATK
jgi:hypothetical protein